MRIYYTDGRTGLTTTDFRYKLTKDDGTLVQDWVTGVVWTEEPAGSYYYDDVLAVAGVRYFVEPSVGEVGGVGEVPIGVDDVPTAVENAAAITSEISGELSIINNLIATGHIVVGQGVGSTQYTDNVDFGPSRTKEGYIVKAYGIVNSLVDFDHILAMDTTDVDGEFDLYLDPGTYILRVEKYGAAVDTVEIEVV